MYKTDSKKMLKKRKYSEDYVKFGFTFTYDRDGIEKPQCFLCAKVFCNDNMRPTKLQEHFIKMHIENSEDSLEILNQKKARFQLSGTLTKFISSSSKKPLLEASYKVAYLIARNKKPHTIGETLIKPCALAMVEAVLGEQQRKQIAEIPMSNDIIHSRIQNMSADVLDQLIDALKKTNFPFALQLDESTDVAQYSQLLVFVRYAAEDCIKEEFLFCEPLLTTTKAADVYRLVDKFFSTTGINWKSNVGYICTDGAPAMLGKKSGFSALVKMHAPQVKIIHCFLHRHALASRTLPENLKSTMNIAIQSVNFIRSRALNHRLFKILCQEVGAEHETLLYHTEVRWLSRGRVFTRLMELRAEVSLFIQEKDNTLYEKFQSQDFVVGLAYLADIFSHLNELNISIQGSEINVLDAREKIAAFKEKLVLWKRRLVKNNYANFPTLENIIFPKEQIDSIPNWIQSEIISHLGNLADSFNEYFTEYASENNGWIRNPFSFNLDSMDDEDTQKDDLIDLKYKALLKQDFFNKNLDQFWFYQKVAYPLLAKTAILALIPFATTYLCESGFSTLVNIKNKARNRLEARHDMRLALSKTAPRILHIINEKQQQPSH